MIRVASYYEETTGLFIGKTVMGNLSDLEANAEPGHKWIEGHHDPSNRKVDIMTGDVVDYQPPQPSPDHEWNATTKLWVLSVAEQKRQAARLYALARIEKLERAQLRSMRELILIPENTDARKRLEEIEVEISSLLRACLI